MGAIEKISIGTAIFSMKVISMIAATILSSMGTASMAVAGSNDFGLSLVLVASAFAVATDCIANWIWGALGAGFQAKDLQNPAQMPVFVCDIGLKATQGLEVRA